MLHVNWKNGETRQRFSLSLSLSLVQEGPGKYRVHARERLRDYYTVPTFPPMRNADIRKITRLALPRHATKRGFPGATEFPPSFDQGGQRRGGGRRRWGPTVAQVNFRNGFAPPPLRLRPATFDPPRLLRFPAAFRNRR